MTEVLGKCMRNMFPGRKENTLTAGGDVPAAIKKSNKTPARNTGMTTGVSS